jgi:ABC-type glutathione transport system ATPase component
MDCAKPVGSIDMETQLAAPTVIDVSQLSVEYVTQFGRTPAVRDLSFTIHQQEVYGLVGESGCGKSTVALACVRYLPAKTVIQGTVSLLSQNILTSTTRFTACFNRVTMVTGTPIA